MAASYKINALPTIDVLMRHIRRRIDDMDVIDRSIYDITSVIF